MSEQTIRLRPAHAAAALATVGALVCSLPASGNEFPNRPLRMVVPFAPGGGADRVGRVLADKMSSQFRQQVIVDNRPGASTIIGSEIVAKATPDGYTLLVCALPHVTNPSLQPKLPYDTIRDFAPVILAAKITPVLVVHAKVPAKSVKELIALSKSSPAGLNYSTGGSGTAAHLAMELLKIASGLNATHIAYKGAGPQVTALVGGQVDLAFATLSTARAHIQSSRLRALAVATLNRSASLPDVPAMSEIGYPGFEAYAWFGLLAPAKTPTKVIQILNREATTALKLPDVQASFDLDGIEAATGTPEQMGAQIKAEIKKWGEVIRKAGISN
ncbi:MAG: tripartite tricarboxylate transporter substrate binding protein [Burkholderiales bacterium]|nr:tripartite tricarboxylate transporter substrate binding protein [Burkholderiales bacterium]